MSRRTDRPTGHAALVESRREAEASQDERTANLAARRGPPRSSNSRRSSDLAERAPLTCPACGDVYDTPAAMARVRENFDRCLNLTCLADLRRPPAPPISACPSCGERYDDPRKLERLQLNAGYCINITCLHNLTELLPTPRHPGGRMTSAPEPE